MKIEVILGVNIDTPMWVSILLENKAENILVIDYELENELEIKKEILYMSPERAALYLKKFNSVTFYKSLYSFPGMGGNMSSLFKRE